MSKRMTETDKWRDKWFRKLTPAQKCLWLYLVDNCDNAGVIELDVELAEFCVGEKIDWGKARMAFGPRIREHGRKIWLVKFVRFQCGGSLSQDCAPHRSIIHLLQNHGLWEEYLRIERDGYDTESPQLDLGAMDDSERPAPHRKRPEPRKSSSELFDDFWNAWPRHPRKVDRTRCLRHWLANDLDMIAKDVMAGLEKWKASEEWRKDECAYIPMVYTWLHNKRWGETDCLGATPRLPKAAPKKNAFQVREEALRASVAKLEKVPADDREAFALALAEIVAATKDIPRNGNGETVADEAASIIEFRNSRDTKP